jgi:GNAT superfamily N-acetyltransferase
MRKIIEAEWRHKDTITENNILMAKETENKELVYKIVKKGVEEVLKNPDKGRYYLCIEKDKVLGQLMITYEWSDWRNCFFYWIQSVFTIPEQRGKGIFKELFKYVLEKVKKEKGCGIRLYVEKNNKIARKVYETLKMSETDYLFYEIEL